jgi:hypothetical protein
MGRGVTNWGSALETNSSAGGGTTLFGVREFFRLALAGEDFFAADARLADFRVEVFLTEVFFGPTSLAFFSGLLVRLAVAFFTIFRFFDLAIALSSRSEGR